MAKVCETQAASSLTTTTRRCHYETRRVIARHPDRPSRAKPHPVEVAEVRRDDKGRVGFTFLARQVLVDLDRSRSGRPPVADEREPVLPAEGLVVSGRRHLPDDLVVLDDVRSEQPAARSPRAELAASDQPWSRCVAARCGRVPNEECALEGCLTRYRREASRGRLRDRDSDTGWYFKGRPAGAVTS